MSTEKLSRKEIREPDPFVRVIAAFWEKLVEHQKPIAIGIGAVVVLFLATAFVLHRGQAKDRESSGALARALAMATRPVAGASADEPDDPQAEKFATAQQKNEALAKELGEVRTRYAGTEAARTATVFWADAQFHLGKLDDAAKGYDEYLKISHENDALRITALEGLGYIHESKGELDKAADAFDRMSREAAGEPAKARAGFQRARMLEAQGKKQDAAAAFQKIKDDFKDAPAARDAEERLALLAMQGVPMPVPEKAPAKPAEPRL